MDNIKNIRGVLFDYGGTIDTNGKHWMELIWESYQKVNIPMDFERFREVYIFVEKQLQNSTYIKKEHGFYDVLKIKINLQLECLTYLTMAVGQNVSFIPYFEGIVNECYNYIQETLKKTEPIIRELSERYRLAVVSNFYGNIETVLKSFSLYEYFNVIVDSTTEGIRKPNPDIYRRGIKRLGLQPEETVVVGDSFSNDIVPAKIIGCKAIWIADKEKIRHKSMGRRPDEIISDFSELKLLL